MIQKIYSIGKYVEKNYPQYCEAYQDLSAGGKYKHLLTINLKEKKGEIVFEKIDYEEIDPEKNQRYLYKTGSPNGTDFSPCCKITKSFDGSYALKIASYFRKNSEVKLVKRISDCLEKSNDDIIREGQSSLAKLSGKEGKALTIIFKDKYIGEYEEIKSIFSNSTNKEYFEKYNTESRAADKQCCICKQSHEVFGFVNTYNFYTVNEDGMVSGGFKKELAWKNYPVCSECSHVLDAGRNYANEQLSFNFYGYSYLLIPNVVITDENTSGKFFSIIEHYNKILGLNEETAKTVLSKEELILDLLSDNKNTINYSMLFYDAPKGINGAVFNIILYLDDVFPSRLRKIFDVIKRINKTRKYLHNIYSDKGDYLFNFGVVRELHPYESKNQQNMKPFLTLAEKILKDNKISYAKILTDMVFQIRKYFKQKYDFRSKTLKFYALIEFLFELDIFYDHSKNNGEAMKEINTQYDKYFVENTSYFDSYEKKVSFLMGMLSQRLLNIQYLDKKSTPFYNKLKGLNITRELLISIFPQVINKLTEYGKNYYKKLEAVISDFFIMSGSEWMNTEKEISFAFALGMSLAKSDYFIEDETEEKEKE